MIPRNPPDSAAPRPLLAQPTAAHRLAGQPDRLPGGPPGHVRRVGPQRGQIDHSERRFQVHGCRVVPLQVRLAGQGHSASLTSAAYWSAVSRLSGSGPSPASLIRSSQPAPYGSELTSPGSSSISGFASITSPSTGAKMSLTDLVDSTSPQGSPAVTAVPAAGMETYTTSPRARCA